MIQELDGEALKETPIDVICKRFEETHTEAANEVWLAEFQVRQRDNELQSLFKKRRELITTIAWDIREVEEGNATDSFEWN